MIFPSVVSVKYECDGTAPNLDHAITWNFSKNKLKTYAMLNFVLEVCIMIHGGLQKD